MGLEFNVFSFPVQGSGHSLRLRQDLGLGREVETRITWVIEVGGVEVR